MGAKEFRDIGEVSGLFRLSGKRRIGKSFRAGSLDAALNDDPNFSVRHNHGMVQ
jgi:hypothetical protein